MIGTHSLRAQRFPAAGRFGAAALLGCLVTSLASPARAQTPVPGFALDRFQPAERGSDWFGLESLDLRGSGRFALGVVGDYARKPLVIYDTADNEVTAPVSDQLVLHLGAALVLGDRVRLAASLPLLVLNQGDPGSLRGNYYSVEEGAAVGDLRLGIDLRLFGDYGSLFTMAAGVQVHLPTGNRAAFSGDGKARIAPRLAVAGTAGLFTWAALAGVDVRLLDDDFGDRPFGTELRFGAAAGLRLADGAVIIGPELSGTTVLEDGAVFKKKATPIEILLGAHFKIADAWQIALGGGPGLERALGSPEFRLLAMLGYSSPFATEPPPPPPPPPDSDGDGILDQDDACPRVRGVPSADPKLNGCPAPVDSDGDGIFDGDDACPREPGKASADPKHNGCPDSDGDGIFDGDDACPREPGVADPDPKKNGCPADRDGDGIPDAVDACPDKPGDRDPDPAKNGCPKVILEEKEIKILERIEFDTGRATIRPESEPVLQAVARVLAEHLDIRKVRVEGHTDSRGDDGYNLRLSRARATAVVAWLVAHEIAPDRLDPVGYGESRAIDSNANEEGRQRNRRVQFIILDRGGSKP